MARRNKKKKTYPKTYCYDYVSTGTVVTTNFYKSKKSSHKEISDVAISVFGSFYYCVGDQCRTT